jgi:Na+-translocating ferredoxin:NAD+ oxidoreductase RnfD subunit
VFIIGAAGLGVLSKVRRLDTGFIFIATYAILEYCRTILFLGWGHDVWLHKLSSGSFWLFALFMITDPMTSPDNRKARIAWVITTAVISFCKCSTNVGFVFRNPDRTPDR